MAKKSLYNRIGIPHPDFNSWNNTGLSKPILDCDTCESCATDNRDGRRDTLNISGGSGNLYPTSSLRLDDFYFQVDEKIQENRRKHREAFAVSHNPDSLRRLLVSSPLFQSWDIRYSVEVCLPFRNHLRVALGDFQVNDSGVNLQGYEQSLCLAQRIYRLG